MTCCATFIFILIRPPPRCTLSPYTTLFRSQMKRIKTNEKARLRNKAVKSSLKTAIRKFREAAEAGDKEKAVALDRKSTRLNSSHVEISYAVFCLKKKINSTCVMVWYNITTH